MHGEGVTGEQGFVNAAEMRVQTQPAVPESDLRRGQLDVPLEFQAHGPVRAILYRMQGVAFQGQAPLLQGTFTEHPSQRLRQLCEAHPVLREIKQPGVGVGSVYRPYRFKGVFLKPAHGCPVNAQQPGVIAARVERRYVIVLDQKVRR